MVRIGGELFIENLDENNAIHTNRTGFTTENPDYRVIKRYVHQWLEEANAIIRKKSALDTDVKKYVVKMRSLRDTLDAVMDMQNAKSDAASFATVDDNDISLPPTNDIFALDDKIKNIMDKKGLSGEVIWSSMIAKDYSITLLPDNSYSVQLREELNNMKFDVGGNTVECIIGYYGKDTSLLCKKNGKFITNIENQLIKNSEILNVDPESVSILSVLYLNYLRYKNDARQLYKSTYDDISS
jgi:hypothetical protein